LIEPGTEAPEFTLPDHEREPVSLADFRGRKLMLVFYPADFSSVCSDQLAIYQEVLGEIEAAGVRLIGISVDSSETHRAFREKLGLEIPLLADFHPKGEVYGVANRCLVLIDEEGIVRWAYETPSITDIPGANLIFDALAEVGAS
jgi:peroxiredoxin